MRVLVIADEAFATRERIMLSRLEIGLADEGVRVVRAIPERVLTAENAPMLSASLTFDDSKLPFMRGVRAARLAESARAVAWSSEGSSAASAHGRVVDVIHAFGGGAWQLGLDLAQRLHACVAFEVWREGLAQRAAAYSARVPSIPRVFLAPDRTIERRLLAADVRDVRLAPWGVHASSRTRPAMDGSRAFSVVITGGGRDKAATLACVEGVAAAITPVPNAMMFVDAIAAQRAGVWSLAKRLRILDRLSLIDDLEARRELAIRADVMIQPEATGEQRSLLLDAMASGMVVLAAADPAVSWLIDNESAWLLEAPTAGAWTKLVTRVLERPEDARQLTIRAAQRVSVEHRATAHVASVLGAYEWVTGLVSRDLRTGAAAAKPLGKA